MSYLNQVALVGNLGKAPEVLNNADKGKFVRLQIATSKKFLNAKEQLVKETHWHTVYVSNGVGKYAANFLEKGDKVAITGELRSSKKTDEKDKTHYSYFISAKTCSLVHRKFKADGVTENKAEAKQVSVKNEADISEFEEEFYDNDLSPDDF